MKVCSDCQQCYDDSINNCDLESHDNLIQLRKDPRSFIEGYRIDKKIESGSPVELYRATHLASEKSVNLRIIGIDDSTADPRPDLRTVSRLTHPHLVRVFEFGELENDEIFVVSEAAAGRTLRKYLLERSPLPEFQAIGIVRQIAEGLEKLHAAGSVHRNISPANIVFFDEAADGFEVRLGNYDFGGLIQQRVVCGANGIDPPTEVFRYFSPEQLAGDEIDFKSDIYSLAVVFYELLLGRPPYASLDPPTIRDFVFNEDDVNGLDYELRALIGFALRESMQRKLHLRPKTTNYLSRQMRHLELIAAPAERIKPEPFKEKAAAGRPEKIPEKAEQMSVDRTARIIPDSVSSEDEEKVAETAVPAASETEPAIAATSETDKETAFELPETGEPLPAVTPVSEPIAEEPIAETFREMITPAEEDEIDTKELIPVGALASDTADKPAGLLTETAEIPPENVTAESGETVRSGEEIRHDRFIIDLSDETIDSGQVAAGFFFAETSDTDIDNEVDFISPPDQNKNGYAGDRLGLSSIDAYSRNDPGLVNWKYIYAGIAAVLAIGFGVFLSGDLNLTGGSAAADTSAGQIRVKPAAEEVDQIASDEPETIEINTSVDAASDKGQPTESAETLSERRKETDGPRSAAGQNSGKKDLRSEPEAAKNQTVSEKTNVRRAETVNKKADGKQPDNNGLTRQRIVPEVKSID